MTDHERRDMLTEAEKEIVGRLVDITERQGAWCDGDRTETSRLIVCDLPYLLGLVKSGLGQ